MCINGKGTLPGKKAPRQMQHDRRVFPDGIQQHGPLKLGRGLAQNVNGFGFQRAQIRQAAA
jgi:hypothetical protein